MTNVLHIRVPPEIKHRLKKLADASGHSPTVLATEALRLYLDEREWQVAEINAAVEEADRTDPGDFIPHDEVMRKMRDFRASPGPPGRVDELGQASEIETNGCVMARVFNSPCEGQ